MWTVRFQSNQLKKAIKVFSSGDEVARRCENKDFQENGTFSHWLNIKMQDSSYLVLNGTDDRKSIFENWKTDMSTNVKMTKKTCKN